LVDQRERPGQEFVSSRNGLFLQDLYLRAESGCSPISITTRPTEVNQNVGAFVYSRSANVRALVSINT